MARAGLPGNRLALNWFTVLNTEINLLRGGARGCEQPGWRGGCRTSVRSHGATFNLQLCKSRGVQLVYSKMPSSL